MFRINDNGVIKDGSYRTVARINGARIQDESYRTIGYVKNGKIQEYSWTANYHSCHPSDVGWWSEASAVLVPSLASTRVYMAEQPSAIGSPRTRSISGAGGGARPDHSCCIDFENPIRIDFAASILRTLSAPTRRPPDTSRTVAAQSASSSRISSTNVVEKGSRSSITSVCTTSPAILAVLWRWTLPAARFRAMIKRRIIQDSLAASPACAKNVVVNNKP